LADRKVKSKMDINKLIMSFCFLILGIFIMFQYKTAKLADSANSGSYTAEIEELRVKLEEEIKKGAELEQQNASLVLQYDNYISDYIIEIEDEEFDDKLELVKKYRIYSGITDVRGEGITITMLDASILGNDDPILFIIHDMDIIRVLNELKAAGAQAISINGERILSVSEIMCTGPTVRINRNRYPVPYVIDAVGDADVLAEALETSLIYELLKDYDISIKIERKSDIVIKKYYGSIEWMIDSLTEVAE
jgi:uncharacterized protein YlxW (UPF0749 family)